MVMEEEEDKTGIICVVWDTGLTQYNKTIVFLNGENVGFLIHCEGRNTESPLLLVSYTSVSYLKLHH